LQWTETHGNTLAFEIIMHTTHAESFLQPLFEREGFDYNEVQETLVLVPSCDRFLQDFNERWQVKDAQADTWELMLQIQQNFPGHVKGETMRRLEAMDGTY
jgi:hypothetical protein